MTALSDTRPLKYQHVEQALRLQAKRLGVGTRLPSERDLSMSFDCSVVTIRRAMETLVEDGVVTRRAGSGTFVGSADGGAAEVPRGSVTSTHTVGLLLHPDGGAYAARVLQEMALVAKDATVDLHNAYVSDYGEDALTSAQALADRGCGALVLPWFPLDRMSDVARFVRQAPVPVSLPVLIPGMEEHCMDGPPRYGTPERPIIEGIFGYFRALGCTRLAFLGPDAPTNMMLQRVLSIFACYSSRHGLETSFGLIGPEAADADRLAASWAERYRGDLAIVSYDDTCALRLITAMHKLGLSAPGDFRIIGRNNIDAVRFCDPPLSSVDTDLRYNCKWLLRNAIGLAKGTPDQSDEYPMHRLIVRESCGGKDAITPAIDSLLAEHKLHVERDDSRPSF